MSFQHLITSLTQLHTFSHAQCDAILLHRGIEVVNAYNPNKSGWERNTVYFGLYWILGWLAFVCVTLVRSLFPGVKSTTSMRLVSLCFLVLGLGLLYVQLEAMASYTDACRAVLQHWAVPQQELPRCV